MSFNLPSQVHATTSPSTTPKKTQQQQHSVSIPIPSSQLKAGDQAEAAENRIDYLGRAQWLRAAVLGANDGLVSTASLMIGVGAVNQTPKAMLVSGVAGLVAGALSMAIGEFVSVYAQYDMEVNALHNRSTGAAADDREAVVPLPSPFRAAGASALAFAVGAVMPLMAGGFVRPWGVRIVAVCAVASLALAGFGGVGAALGGAKAPWRSAVRVLLGGLVAMLLSFGVLKLFGLAFGFQLD